MKYSSKLASFLLLSCFILLASAVGCTPDSTAVETKVALTVTAIAVETMTANTQETQMASYVAETVTAMANVTEGNTSIPIVEIQTIVAETVRAQAEIPDTPFTAMLQMRVIEVPALNVRSGPDTCFNVIATLNEGKTASVLGQDPTHSWYKVQLSNNVVGWVWADYTELVDNSTGFQIPLATPIPRCPTPTPSRTPTIASSPIPPQPGGPSSTPTLGFTPTVGGSPTQPSCSYPPCITPTVGPTPTPRTCSYPPCTYP